MTLRDPMPQAPECDEPPPMCAECFAREGEPCASGCPEATIPAGFADEGEPDYDDDYQQDEEEP